MHFSILSLCLLLVIIISFDDINLLSNFFFISLISKSIFLFSLTDIVIGFNLFVNKALPLTILTAIFSFIALYLLNNSFNLDSAILKIIFIGLASLTFPHILLEYFLEKNEK